MKMNLVCALLIGRKGSSGYPGKNLLPAMGRPLVAYPLLAAGASKYVDRIYVSTDSPEIRLIGENLGAEYIQRPPELATKAALGEDAYIHGYLEIQKRLAKTSHQIEMLVLLMANAASITAETIDEGIEVLRSNPHYDSAVTVSCYNMWSPLRARRIGEDGLLHPFVPFEAFGDPKTLNCDRDSQGDVWFADMDTSIIRPKNLDTIHNGLLPQKWMGQKIYPIKQWGACDIDYEWQIPGLIHRLEKLGFSETKTPYEGSK